MKKTIGVALVLFLVFLPVAFANDITIEYTPTGGTVPKTSVVTFKPGQAITLKSLDSSGKTVKTVLTYKKGTPNTIQRQIDGGIVTTITPPVFHSTIQGARELVHETNVYTVGSGKLVTKYPDHPEIKSNMHGSIVVKPAVTGDPPKKKPGTGSVPVAKTSGAKVDEKLTKEHENALEHYITQNGGNPQQWKINEKGEIMCVAAKCSLSPPNCYERCGSGDYVKGQSITPPGGYFDGKTITDKNGNVKKLEEGDRKGENLAALKEMDPGFLYTTGKYFDTASKALAESRGLSGWSSLLIPEESLQAWKNTVDEAFATFYLGTEYWSSALCGSYVDGEAHGIAFFEGAGGLSQVGAFVRASRTPAAVDENYQYEYIYRIEFSVRNGGGESDPNALDPMRFNIELKGDRSVRLFLTDQELEPGDRARRVGRDSIAQDSNTFYNEACMVFNRIPHKWKVPSQGVCVPILDSGSAPSGYGAGDDGGSTGGGGSSSGGLADI